MIENKIRNYNVENPLVLEEINEYLNRKGEYGFTKGEDGSDCLCFFNKKDIFAITYTDGRIRLGPSISPLIIHYIEKELNNEILKKKN
jgi:hypothetical protein